MKKHKPHAKVTNETAAGLNDIKWPAAVGVLALVVLVFFADLILGGSRRVISHPLTDLASYFVFSRDFGFRQLAHGNLALWNPHVFCGVPFFGGFQAALLYPPNWIYLILPLGTAINLEVAGHMFLLGLFTLLWARRKTGSWMGGTIAGVIVMLGGSNYLHIYAGHMTMVDATAWMPLILLAVDLIIERGSSGAAWMGAGAVAMQIHAGHPQTLYATALAAGAYFLARLPDCPNKARGLGLFTFVYASAILLGAWQLSAAMEAGAESTRGNALSYPEAASFSLPPLNLLTLAAPWVLGKNFHDGRSFEGLYIGKFYFWEMCVYAGVGTLFLAAVGLLKSRGRERWIFASLAALFLLFSLGDNTPLHRVLFNILPGFNRFRGSCKFSSQALMFIAMLAAMGWREFTARHEGWRRAGAVLGAVAAACLLGALVILASGGMESGGVWGAVLRGIKESGQSYIPAENYDDGGLVRASARQAAWALFGAAAWFGLIAAAVGLRGRLPLAVHAVPLILLLDLLVFSRGTRPAFDLEEKLHPESLRGVRESLDAEERLLVPGGAENALMSNGLFSVWGYDPQVTQRFAEWMSFAQGFGLARASYMVQVRQFSALYQLVRCGRVLVPENGGMALKGAPPTIGHAFLASNFKVVSGREAIFQGMAANESNLTGVVFIESDPGFSSVTTPPVGSAVITADYKRETDRMTCEVETSQPAIVVITDAYSRGWRVRSRGADGGKYSIIPVDHFLMGVPVGAGKHTLELEYSPVGVRAGQWITILSVIAFAGLGIWIFRKNGPRVSPTAPLEKETAIDAAPAALEAQERTSKPRAVAAGSVAIPLAPGGDPPFPHQARWFAGLMIGSVILRIILLFTSQRYLQSDEALVGMIVLDILDGLPIPIFPYGNAYAGGHIMEALLMLPLFKVFGPSDLIVSGVPAMISCAYIAIVYGVLYRFFGKRLALVASFLLSISCAFVTYNFYVNGSMITSALGWLGLGFFLSYYFSARPRTWSVFASGVMLGLAYYGFDYALFYLIALVVLWVIRDRWMLRSQWGQGLALFSGLVLGAMPLIVFNLFNDFANLKNLTQRTAMSAGSIWVSFPVKLLRLFTHDLPAFFSTSIYDFAPKISPLSWLAHVVFVAALGWTVWRAKDCFMRLVKGLTKSEPLVLAHGERMAYILLMAFLYMSIYCATSAAGQTPRYLLPLYPMIPIIVAAFLLDVFARHRPIAYALGGVFLLTQAAFIVRLASDKNTTEWNISTDGRDMAKLADYLEKNGLTTVVAPYEVKWKLMFATNRRVVCASYLFGFDRESRYNMEVIDRVNRDGIRPAMVFDKEFRMARIVAQFNPAAAFDLLGFFDGLKAAGITFKTDHVGDYVVLHGFSRGFPLPDPYRPASQSR